MRLAAEQAEEYRRRGWIVLPSALAAAELDVLEDAYSAVLGRDGPEVAREPNGEPHVLYGMHLWDDRFATLARHPAVLEPVMQLLGGGVFVHQSRVNTKQTGGSIVAWHQDWGTYHRVDGVPEPRGVMIGVFLDDVNACNAPILAVPGSHREGLVSEAVIDPGVPDARGAARHRFDITQTTMKRLVDRHGLEAIMGPRGSVLLMNMAVVHGSSVNIAPTRRVILYLNVSACDNQGRTFARPEWQAARDFGPLQPLGTDCLLRLARAA
jgi:ectoine hydroxylase